jgi:hypothetical protein
MALFLRPSRRRTARLRSDFPGRVPYLSLANIQLIKQVLPPLVIGVAHKPHDVAAGV